MTDEKIGIVGLGVVGGALERAFEAAGKPVHALYDPFKGHDAIQDMAECTIIFLCVGTPENGGDLDRISVWEAVSALSRLPVKDGTLIAVRSTVPPGTSAELTRVHPWLQFASTPEFLVQADPDRSMRYPDRIVIGANTPEASGRLADVLTSITMKGQLVVVSPVQAELLKLCANVLLASKVAIANELSDVCASYDVSWESIREGIGLDPRIGASHLEVTPERGFGGACFPKDLRGLISASRRAGHEPELLQAVEDLNKRVRDAAPDFEVLANEAEQGYDIDRLIPRLKKFGGEVVKG